MGKLWQLGGQLELPIAELPTNEQRLSAIVGHLLHSWQRFVIVLDHVKSVADIELVLTVAEPLLPLAQIIVTSRCDISHNQVQRFRLTELREAHALELLRLEAKRHGYAPLSDEEAQELYQEVGGGGASVGAQVGGGASEPHADGTSALRSAPGLAISQRTLQPSL